ncbi:MAG: hypothetical protein LC104_21295 [Bacteroidales bacterium]|nr:hypothetical protein [Bacteroidales bacterium]
MSDFSAEDLFDAIDRGVQPLLERGGMTEPPVDAILLVQEQFDYRITFAEDQDEEPPPGRFGPRPRRQNAREIVLRIEQSDAGQNAVCARACARELLPEILRRLGVVPGTETRSGQNQLLGLIVPRLLLPTRWFSRDARKAGFDLMRLKEHYPTASYEMIAARMLDIAEDPLIIAVIDDGIVASRRGNLAAAGKKLTAAEQLCLEQIREQGEPQTTRQAGWTVQGWPIPDGPFSRIILRAVPDEV